MQTRFELSITRFGKYATKILIRHVVFPYPIVIMRVGGNEGCILNRLT